MSRTELVSERLEAAPRQRASFLLGLLVASLVTTSLFPYVAVPIGSNTNIPVSSIISLLFLPWAVKSSRIVVTSAALFVLPVAATLLGQLFSSTALNSYALIAQPLHLAAFLGFAVAAREVPDLLRICLRAGLWVSGVLALVQKFFFLDHGVVPFIAYYATPGYASVEANAYAIANFIRRPFGAFPEPSFMAGTIALVCASYLLLQTRRLTVGDYALIAVVVATILLSGSGSGVVSIGLLLVITFYRGYMSVRRSMILIFAGVVSVIAALWILESRMSSSNYSWSDRTTSLIAGLRYLFSDLQTLLLGSGTGTAPVLFATGKVSLAGLPYHGAIPDMFSTYGRLVFECGLLVGGAILVLLIAPVFKAYRGRIGLLGGVSAVSLIVVVGVLTISYESAAWLWAFPGICLGVSVATNSRGNAE